MIGSMQDAAAKAAMEQNNVDQALPCRQFITQESSKFSTCEEIPVDGTANTVYQNTGASSLAFTQTGSGGRQDDELTSTQSVFHDETVTNMYGHAMTQDEAEKEGLRRDVEIMRAGAAAA